MISYCHAEFISGSRSPGNEMPKQVRHDKKNKFGMTLRDNRGITFIELLIGIGFLIVIVVGAFMFFNPFDRIKMAEDNRRKEDLAAIQNALEQYYKDVGNYPSSTLNYEIKTIDANDPVKEWGSSWQPYFQTLPNDPKSPKKTYVYIVSSALQAFYLYASLEGGGKDKEACNLGKACPGLGSNSVSDTACGGVCNYGVSSSNVSP